MVSNAGAAPGDDALVRLVTLGDVGTVPGPAGAAVAAGTGAPRIAASAVSPCTVFSNEPVFGFAVAGGAGIFMFIGMNAAA